MQLRFAIFILKNPYSFGIGFFLNQINHNQKLLLMYSVECPYCNEQNILEEEADTVVCEECHELFDYYIDEQGNINTDTSFNSY